MGGQRGSFVNRRHNRSASCATRARPGAPNRPHSARPPPFSWPFPLRAPTAAAARLAHDLLAPASSAPIKGGTVSPSSSSSHPRNSHSLSPPLATGFRRCKASAEAPSAASCAAVVDAPAPQPPPTASPHRRLRRARLHIAGAPPEPPRRLQPDLAAAFVLVVGHRLAPLRHWGKRRTPRRLLSLLAPPTPAIVPPFAGKVVAEPPPASCRRGTAT